MDLKKSKRLLLILAAVYWIFVIGIYAIANEQFRYDAVSGQAPASETVIGELTDGLELNQKYSAPAELLSGIQIMTATYDRTNTGVLVIEIKNSAGEVLMQKEASVSLFENNKYTHISFVENVGADVGEELTLTLRTKGCSQGNAITIYAGSNGAQNVYLMNGEEGTGQLCLFLKGYNHISFYKVYWVVVIAAFALLVVYTIVCWKAALRGKSNPVVSLCTVYSRYSFLIKQLVNRDFKTKYKRSALGMAWSFMNPLLTMSVQYVVFSTLFKSDIDNYPVYLLTGIVFFNFFNEAATMGMTSITGNATLIKKVYMPKYIYPVSRILSSLVNFAFALMPLFLMMLFTGTPFRLSMLLLIFDVLCMFAFIVGITLLLTTSMTFFQDTQFLWSVLSMMWQYLTPVFYPETIIPANWLPIYRMNPMYQFISFARVCITDGISPEPIAYFNCLFAGVAVLLLGVVVFKKHQNKFVLYL